MAAVQFTHEAVRDLNEIWDFLAEEDAATASRLINDIEQRCAELAELPFVGRPRPEFSANVRSLFVDPFIIFYQLDQKSIEILRIYHSSRDPDGAM